MKRKRILPCLDIRNGRVVKGQQFAHIEDVENPVTLAKMYDEAGADELVMYDITATLEGRTMFTELIEKISSLITIPVTVGGGIQTIEDIKRALQAGAKKVSINSAALTNPSFIKKASAIFGSEKIVIAIDAKQVGPNTWNAYTHGGKKDTGIDAVTWAKKVVRLGAGEIVLNSMDQDGMKTGFNIPLQLAMKKAVSVPLIASGGAGTIDDFIEVFQEGHADGALAASVFHFGELTIESVKRAIEKENHIREGAPKMIFDKEDVQFDQQGLIPAIIQDDDTGDVLMLAYMNKESLDKSIATKETWFYSRSRNELWNKGATSGNTQEIKRMTLDCDADALLVTVRPKGPACHTGEKSCFYRPILNTLPNNRHVISQLTKRIADRKANPVEGAYTTYLFNEGIDKILKKVGEESSEVIIGAKNNDTQEVVWEIADLVYHTLVLMEEMGIRPSDITEELTNRHITKKEDPIDE